MAVSQATLESGSSAKQASKMASDTWSLLHVRGVFGYGEITRHSRNLVGVPFAHRLGGEEEGLAPLRAD